MKIPPYHTVLNYAIRCGVIVKTSVFEKRSFECLGLVVLTFL